MNKEAYMKRCFDLAKKGLGMTLSNPLVGCVIVHEDQIIGEGWHQKFGGNHAEVMAIESVKKPELLQESTLFVNLEPCSHFGKTPPCSDLIVKKGIPKVVISNTDPNPLVHGKGIQILREQHIDVEVGILKDEGEKLNERFITFYTKNRPYVILKWAESANGYFAFQEEKQTWLSTELTKRQVHLWRQEEMAILVGTKTALIDNPKLTNRFFSPTCNPLRIIIDRKLEIPKFYHVYQDGLPTVFVTEKKQENTSLHTFWTLDFTTELPNQILQHLTNHGISSLIVEGGAITLQHFIDENLWDEIRLIQTNSYIKNGIISPTFNGRLESQEMLETDVIKYFRPIDYA